MRILVTKRIPKVGIQLLEDKGYQVDVLDLSAPLPHEDFIKLSLNYDALLCAGFNKIDSSLLEKNPQIKAIALYSVGFDNVDFENIKKFKVPISNTPDVLSDATADIAFLLMLSVARRSFFMADLIRKGLWKNINPTDYLGQELNGKTLGIFGMGRIGYAFAKRAKAAYNMNIIYHNRSPKPELAAGIDARYVDFETLIIESDILSVHANLSDSTKNLFNKSVFNNMKSNAIFINTARGAIHNEVDLYQALKEGVIWGAGLDVTNPEPMLADNPLLSLSNVCVLPHIGSATAETRDAMAIMAANNIIAALENKSMPQIIDPNFYD